MTSTYANATAWDESDWKKWNNWCGQHSDFRFVSNQCQLCSLFSVDVSAWIWTGDRKMALTHTHLPYCRRWLRVIATQFVSSRIFQWKFPRILLTALHSLYNSISDGDWTQYVRSSKPKLTDSLKPLKLNSRLTKQARLMLANENFIIALSTQ